MDMDLDEITDAGFLDGEADALNDAGMYQSYGLSVDEEELSDEEKEAYEEGYFSGYQLNEDDSDADDSL